MNDTLYFAKRLDNATIPSKRDEDAGYDLYAVMEEREVRIKPGEIYKFNTGISCAFPEDYVFVVKERGSTGNKCMAVRMGVVDSGFRGEIVVGINNTSANDIVVSKAVNKIEDVDGVIYYPYNKAIAQGILLYCPKVRVAEISLDELLSMGSERQESMLGASEK